MDASAQTPTFVGAQSLDGLHHQPLQLLPLLPHILANQIVINIIIREHLQLPHVLVN